MLWLYLLFGCAYVSVYEHVYEGQIGALKV